MAFQTGTLLPAVCPLTNFLSNDQDFRLSFWAGGLPLDYFIVAVADVLADEDVNNWKFLLDNKFKKDLQSAAKHDQLWSQIFWRLLDFCEKTRGGPEKLTNSVKRNVSSQKNPLGTDFSWRSSRIKGEYVKKDVFKANKYLLFLEKNQTVQDSTIKLLTDSKEKCGVLKNFKDSLKFNNNKGYMAILIWKLYELLPEERQLDQDLFSKSTKEIVAKILGSPENINKLDWMYPLMLPAELRDVYPGSNWETLHDSNGIPLIEKYPDKLTMFGEVIAPLEEPFLVPTTQQQVTWNGLKKGDPKLTASKSYAASKSGSVLNFQIDNKKGKTTLTPKRKEKDVFNSDSGSDDELCDAEALARSVNSSTGSVISGTSKNGCCEVVVRLLGC